MSVNVLKTSRLTNADLTELAGYEFWAPTQPLTIPLNSDDVYYTLQSSDRLDTLSSDYYGTPTLGWVIAYANNYKLPSIEMTPGCVVRVPSGRYVFGILLASS